MVFSVEDICILEIFYYKMWFYTAVVISLNEHPFEIKGKRGFDGSYGGIYIGSIEL